MAWENFKVEHQRLQRIEAFTSRTSSMTDLCKLYKISRKTAYKWYKRFLVRGDEGLKDLSKASHCPNRCYTEYQIDRAIDLKHRHPNWGPKKVIGKLQELYPHEDWPSPTRLYEIFKDYHLLKGWFQTGDKRKCEPLRNCFQKCPFQRSERFLKRGRFCGPGGG